MMQDAIGLALAKGYILAASILTCPAAAQAPAVTFTFDNKPPVVDLSKNRADLSQVKISTQFSHHPKEQFLTEGITDTNIGIAHKMSFKAASNAFGRDVCLSLHEVNVTLTYAPVVYIASENAPNTCKYNTTWLHELQHVNIDALTLKEFAPHFEAAAKNAAAGFGVQGPLQTDEEVAAAQNAFSARLQESFSGVVSQMSKTLHQRQQLIDTRQEYMRLSRACP